MGKVFDSFMETLREEKLDDFVKAYCFGHFLDISKDKNVRFQITHDLWYFQAQDQV